MAEIQTDFPLAKLTTVRTGGPAEYFARAGSARELSELLAWAKERVLAFHVIGSGSNLLIADEGVRGLVVKLDRELSRVDVSGEGMRCGGGARLPSVAARAASEGLSGIEFGVNIPGTIGGAVRMNANAYGGALEKVLEWAEIVTPEGSERRASEALALVYRDSNLRSDEVVARVALKLVRAPSEEVKATLLRLRESRHEAQPKGIKTFGSTFKNPPGQTAGLLLSSVGCGGFAVGGARFSPKHANFVENHGGASTADIVALMAQGRRRVLEETGFALEPEVQVLGQVIFPW